MNAADPSAASRSTSPPPPPPGVVGIAAALDAAAQGEDLLCPLCDYNLRGLVEPRCPECGYRFEWSQLRDQKLQFHPYLFEHHPKRNVWSFCRTLLGGLRPLRFWERLNPGQPSRPGRLFGYWAVSMAIALVAGVVVPTIVRAVLINANFRAELARQRTVMPDGTVLYRSPRGFYTKTPPVVPGPFDPNGGLKAAVEDVAFPHAAWWVVATVWPWATVGALMIFRISMSRAKLRPIHVRRCVLYSFDACVWVALAVLGLSLFGFALGISGPWAGYFEIATAWLLPVLWGVVTYRLGCAYGEYLQFSHPFGTVILSQIVVALATFIAFGSVGSAVESLLK